MPARAETAWKPLADWRVAIVREVRGVLDLLEEEEDAALAAATRPLCAGWLEPLQLERTLAIGVLGAQGGDPGLAIPVCVVATLWWAGANAVDDVLDRDVDADSALSPEVQLVAGVACATAVPMLYLTRLASKSPGLIRAWLDDLASSSIAAASGEIADVTSPTALEPAEVLELYARKTGAAYARDAAMATRLAFVAADVPPYEWHARLQAWREIGRTIGLLRQLSTDHHDRHRGRRPDIATGAPTLLLAHGFSTTHGSERDALGSLVAAARTGDDDAQAELHDRLLQDDVVHSYTADLRALHRRGARALDAAADPGPYRDALRARMDALALWAVPAPQTLEAS